MDHDPQYLRSLAVDLADVDPAGRGIVLDSATDHDLADTRNRSVIPLPRILSGSVRSIRQALIGIPTLLAHCPWTIRFHYFL